MSLIPVADKKTKAAKIAAAGAGDFHDYSDWASITNRDDWVYAMSMTKCSRRRLSFLI